MPVQLTALQQLRLAEIDGFTWPGFSLPENPLSLPSLTSLEVLGCLRNHDSISQLSKLQKLTFNRDITTIFRNRVPLDALQLEIHSSVTTLSQLKQLELRGWLVRNVSILQSLTGLTALHWETLGVEMHAGYFQHFWETTLPSLKQLVRLTVSLLVTRLAICTMQAVHLGHARRF